MCSGRTPTSGCFQTTSSRSAPHPRTGFHRRSWIKTYMGLDTQKARELWASASAHKTWRTTELPQGFHIDLAKLWTKSASEVSAYDELWRKYVTVGASDENIKDEVAKFYLVGRNLADAFVQEFIRKVARSKYAAYWVAQNRQYRVTREEHKAGKPVCPKCGTAMRRTTYKMDKGAKHRLFACPKDLFLIKQESILSPEGQPVEW